MKGGAIRAYQLEIAQQRAQLQTWDEAARQFTALLHSAKFAGLESDGQRKDWIATADVLHWLSDTRNAVSESVNLVTHCPQCGAVHPPFHPACIHHPSHPDYQPA